MRTTTRVPRPHIKKRGEPKVDWWGSLAKHIDEVNDMVGRPRRYVRSFEEILGEEDKWWYWVWS